VDLVAAKAPVERADLRDGEGVAPGGERVDVGVRLGVGSAGAGVAREFGGGRRIALARLARGLARRGAAVGSASARASWRERRPTSTSGS
uniref:hypothetical protein n=1 Tax=Clavibacter michiganensis TaxID=28447 RepID=UPI002931951B